MGQAAATVISTRSGSFILQPCKASGSSLRSYLPPTAGAQPACQSVTLARSRQSHSFRSLGSETLGSDSYSGSGALPKRGSSRNLHSEAAVPNGSGTGGKDLSLDSLHFGRFHIHRASGRLHSGFRVDDLGRRVIDGPTASAALVDNATRKSKSLVLTVEDLPRHSSNSERSEFGIGSQISRVSREKGINAPRQLCVAVDVDEVLGSFLASLNLFIQETCSEHHSISEYYIYDFKRIWNCSQGEANRRVHAFFDSDRFKNGISPIPGAHQVLLQLASYCQLVVVTSRQHVIRDRTLEWIDRYYAGIFKEVHFGNHFALEGPPRSKSEICRCLGANILIDDNPAYAIECAENGIEVLLFDLHGGYAWSKTPCGPRHPLITRVKDWDEVEQALLARTCAKV